MVAKGIRHYIVESTDYKTLYENDLPIYNKVLENEYIRLYELKKQLKGRVIKIKTDAIVVEGHKRVELSDEIGGSASCASLILFIKSISSEVREKWNVSRPSAICIGFSEPITAGFPCCVTHRINTCAGVRPCELAMPTTLG